ncbi:tetratricopeptide repeat protein [Olivibacter sitiensis]|uniref:tetratricopeptide repeat protein n=1 Tax=Olivibacter sitiensis TaxID=376470 RepID=UPI001B7FC0D2|nr:tetratricopeptide repeat protein [Olivibacter sitiensis]
MENNPGSFLSWSSMRSSCLWMPLALGVWLMAFSMAQAKFTFNTNCQQAYQDIMSLRLNAAKERLEQEKRTLPENDFIPLLENYYDYIYLLCTDDKPLFERAKKSKGERLNRLAAGDKDSPYYLWAQAEVNLQWALLRGRYGEYLNSALEIKRTNALLKESIDQYPDFLPSQKAYGMVQAVLGALPSGAQKALGTLGVRGNATKGKEMLENAVKGLSGSVFYDETVFYLAQVYMNITNEQHGYERIESLCKQIDSQSLLKTYILAQYATKSGHGARAISILQSKPSGRAYIAYPYLTYLFAIAKMNRLDSEAKKIFLQFINENKQRSFTKDAYLRLAWISVIEGDKAAYEKYTQLVKTKGYSFEERDKQALNEIADAAPNADLLKARLLYDGGDLQGAKNCLLRLDPNKMPLQRDKIEFCYRYGRIFQDAGSMANALKFYKSAIDLGSDSPYYYAANAALLSGNIYEQQKNYEQAILFYQKAIDMKNHPYESSIEHKAKEGISRLKGIK